jgi:hypothetical protein
MPVRVPERIEERAWRLSRQFLASLDQQLLIHFAITWLANLGQKRPCISRDYYGASSCLVLSAFCRDSAQTYLKKGR